MSGLMDPVIVAAQAYKVAPIGPDSEKALVALCTEVEKIYAAGLEEGKKARDPFSDHIRAFFHGK